MLGPTPRDVHAEVDDAPLDMRLCEVSDAFQEGHGTFIKKSAEELSATFEREGFLPLWMTFDLRGRLGKRRD